MSPTRIDELPPLMARASGAWIWSMSHCRPDRLSLPGAGVPGAIGDSPAAVSWSRRVAKRALSTTPSTPELAASVARNESLLDRAIVTPICL